MNRRNLFRMLSALPLAGSWFAESVVAAPVSVAPAPRPISLASVRDLLLPSFWDCRVTAPYNMDFDIQLDYENDCLLVVGRCFVGEPLGFAITRHAINTGSYKDAFRPSMLHLIQCLKDSAGMA